LEGFLKPVIKPNKESLQGALWKVNQAPPKGSIWEEFRSLLGAVLGAWMRPEVDLFEGY